MTYFERADPLPATTLLRNDGEYAWQHGADVVVRRRLAGRWMLSGSLSWCRSAWFYPEATRDYTDPTNIDMRHGREYARQARWSASVSGSVRLPWGFATSANWSSREGYPYDRVVRSPSRGALGSTSVSIAPYGSERYGSVHRLDGRLQRKLSVGHADVVLALNVFNALNSNVVLARNRRQNSLTGNRVTEVIDPRSLRVDAKVSW